MNPEPGFNLTTELKNVSNSRKVDGAVLNGDGDAVAVIELKSTTTTDLDFIETQAFGYKNHQPKCVYVITSNDSFLCFCMEKSSVLENQYIVEPSKNNKKNEVQGVLSKTECRNEFWKAKEIKLSDVQNFHSLLQNWYKMYPGMKTGVTLYLKTQKKASNIDQVFIDFIIAFERIHKKLNGKILVGKSESELKKRIEMCLS